MLCGVRLVLGMVGKLGFPWGLVHGSSLIYFIFIAIAAFRLFGFLDGGLSFNRLLWLNR